MAFPPPASTNYNVLGGYNNTLTNSGYNVVLGVGIALTECQRSVVLGGNGLSLSYNSKSVFINCSDLVVNNAQDGITVVGGYGHLVNAASPQSTVIGGYGNTMNGTGNTLIGGTANIIDDGGSFYCVIVGGQTNSIEGARTGAAIVGGKFNRVVADFAAAFGIRASATRQGQQALNSVDVLDASGPGSKDDHGMHRLTGYVTTADATPTNVLAFTLEAGVAYDVFLTVVGNEDGGGNRAAYRRRAVVYRDGAASAALQGSVDTIGTDQESNAAWDLSVTVSGNDLLVTVTGVAATDINWLCSVDWTAIGEVVN